MAAHARLKKEFTEDELRLSCGAWLSVSDVYTILTTFTPKFKPNLVRERWRKEANEIR